MVTGDSEVPPAQMASKQTMYTNESSEPPKIGRLSTVTGDSEVLPAPLGSCLAVYANERLQSRKVSYDDSDMLPAPLAS